MSERKYPDMFVEPEDDPRELIEPRPGDERSTLLHYLRWYRASLEVKCGGLDAAGMAARSVPPSTMSLLGLVRHLAEVERTWFRQVLAGEDTPRRFRDPDGTDHAFEVRADPAMVEQAWTYWREEVAYADQYLAGVPDLEGTGTTRHGERISAREVLVHMIEEYARHLGHADLLRERVDGRTGQ